MILVFVLYREGLQRDFLLICLMGMIINLNKEEVENDFSFQVFYKNNILLFYLKLIFFFGYLKMYEYFYRLSVMVKSDFVYGCIKENLFQFFLILF